MINKIVESIRNIYGEQQTYQTLYQNLFSDGVMMYAGELLARAARLYPSVKALECVDQSITYAALYKRSVEVSKALQAIGVQKGDRVLLLYENSIEFYVAYYGIWQTGAVVAPLNTFLHAKELRHIIEDAKPAAIVVSNTLQEKVESLFKEGLFTVPLITDTVIKTPVDKTSVVSFTPVGQDSNVVAVILYTSGTTGFPKGVMLSSKNILTNLIQGLCLINVTHDDKVLAALPLFHSFAQSSCVWGSFFVGGTTIVVPKIERRSLLEGIAHRPTFVVGVPALYGLFCLMKTIDFSSVRYFVCGGDALPDKIRIAFELVYRRRLCNGYGLTETAPLIAVNFDDACLQPNTVGRLAYGLEASLRDEHGLPLKDTSNPGELWVKGDNVMLGYYNAPEATAAVLKGGWLNTGDLAFFDRAKRLVIAGRSKDLIVHKGFNIYPVEIENVLMHHPAVMQAVVVGKAEEDVGEVPIGFVVLKEGALFSEPELRTICEAHLAVYKIPRVIYHVYADELPVNSLRKVNKKKLQLWLVEGIEKHIKIKK